jgi:stearoyl-CoA desaturase (delta-9 desaturase)
MTRSTVLSMAVRPPPAPEPKPMIIPGRAVGEQVLVKVFVLVPFAALVAAVPIAWGWGLGWTNPARLARLTTTDRTRHRDTPNEELTP